MNLDELLDFEIAFHSEVENPWYWRVICRLFNKRECHKAVVSELRFIKKYYKRVIDEG
jgi:hypothetical protein